MSRLPLLAGALLLTACAGSKPPAHWNTGGGRLDMVPARWAYRGDSVEIRPRGLDYAEVLVDGDLELVIDRVGRVYTNYQQPIGLLEPDGRLVGKEQELLGMVGSSFAALPGKANAWLALSNQGMVVKFEDDGSQKQAGQWVGCNVTPYAAQACLLVTYMLYFDDEGTRAKDLPPVPVGPVSPVGGLLVQ